MKMWRTGLNLTEFQEQHGQWLSRNFPDQQPHDALLGLAEEVGELAHAHLKHQQGIRGMDEEEYVSQATDAIGDIVIYLASYCNTNGFNLEACVREAWDQVSGRDWQERPETG